MAVPTSEWSVALEAELSEPTEMANWLDGLIDALEATNADASSVAGTDATVSVIVTVEARNPYEAMRIAESRVVVPALEKAGLRINRFLSGEAVVANELARRLEQPNLPELAGISEVAEILGVTKQRASELTKQRTFPRPLMRLAAGPVWTADTVRLWSETWERRPGRPAKALSSGTTVASALALGAAVLGRSLRNSR